MNLIGVLSLLALLTIVYFAWRSQGKAKALFFVSLLLKLTAGFGVGLLYSHYYQGGDTLNYFHDAQVLTQLASDDFFRYVRVLVGVDDTASLPLIYSDQRALFFSKLCSIMNMISGGNYWLMSCVFSIISFASAWYLCSIIAKYYPAFKYIAAFALLFFPSIIFWTSGVLKESLAFACIAYLSATFLRVWRGEKIFYTEIVLAVVAAWLLWSLKYYYMGVLGPILVTTLVYKVITRKFFGWNAFAAISSWIGLLVVPALLVTFLHPNFNLNHLVDVIVENFQTYQRLDEKAIVYYRPLEPTVTSLVINAPFAFAAGLFRPAVWEADNVFHVLASLENLGLLVCTLAIVFSPPRGASVDDKVLGTAIFVYCAALCLFLALSTPNLGTLSRYRIGFLPFYVILITNSPPIRNLLQRLFGRLVP